MARAGGDTIDAMPRIAIPMPHSTNPEYAARAIPQYERAVALAGGEPLRIALDQSDAQIKQLIASCDAVLLPGSSADVDPARFHAARSPHTAAADPRRDAVDDLLLDDAYALRKPILGICYGLQSLNVHLHGSLVQHIPDFLPEATRGKINHEAGRKIPIAHTVAIDQTSRLAEICRDSRPRLSGRAQLGGDPTLAGIAARNPGSAIQSNCHPERSEGSMQLDSELARSANREEHRSPSREGHGFGFEPALSKRSAPKGAESAPLERAALAAGEKELVLPVNSSHHQSADSIGSGLRIVARCPDDGIIEALEGTADDHFRAVAPRALRRRRRRIARHLQGVDGSGKEVSLWQVRRCAGR
jgi:gamma-glutamyl-gamma-aminobutyrate hydrolase PuuD